MNKCLAGAKRKLQMLVYRRFYLSRIILYFLLICVSFIFLLPFLRMIIQSVMTYTDLNDPSVNWIPHTLDMKNYAVANHHLNYWKHMGNSLLVTLTCTIGHILACSFIAYGFARFRFRGRGLLFAFAILSILVPPQVLILPQYMYYLKLGWLNTYLPIIVPCFLGYGLRGGLYIYIFRQFFMGLPVELEDAAAVDGLSSLGTFFRIVLPISRPSILVTFLVSFVWHWNDYYEPSFYLTFQEQLPLPSMLQNVLNGNKDYFKALLEGTLDTLVTDGVVMAAIFLCCIPPLIIYFLLQRGFIQGVERSGIVE